MKESLEFKYRIWKIFFDLISVYFSSNINNDINLVKPLDNWSHVFNINNNILLKDINNKILLLIFYKSSRKF